MTKRLSKADLTAIRERAEKATEGEWRYYPSRLYSHDMICVGDFDGQNIAEIRSRESDGEFIAYARQDIPKLLAEIERYREIERKMRSLTGRAFITTDKQVFEIIREINEIYYGGDIE